MAAPVVEHGIRRQAWLGGLLIATGVGIIAIFLLSVLPSMHSWLDLLPPLFGLWLIWFGRQQRRGAGTRRHGLRVEGMAVSAAERYLPHYGFKVTHNVETHSRGDVDIVIEHDGRKAPVEVKSFRFWKTHSARCEHAIHQVHSQRDFLHSEAAFIWLPDAPAGWWRSHFGKRVDDVRVVFGSAKSLGRIARRAMR